MADVANEDKLIYQVRNLKIENGTPSQLIEKAENSDLNDPTLLQWGLTIDQLYRLGLKFYKDKEGKAVNVSYHDKLRLVSYSQQVTNGPFKAENYPPLGVLDVIGRDRRDAWQALGSMGKEEAMLSFINLLDKCCTAFKPFVEAQKADMEMKKQQTLLAELKAKEDVQKEIERLEQIKRDETEREAAEERKRQIQDALNAQTFHQFKDYAEQQYPGNPEQQAVLVRQLQEQHYHQYMQQLLQQQHQAVQTNGTYKDNVTEVADKSEQVDQIYNEREQSEEEQDDGLPPISPPSMWTRKEIQEFKDSIRKEGGEAIIKVGRGETVTVRVPTHDNGNCLFWEFATDSYDIGFGVYFEWTKSETNQVSVHIQDSDDDEDDMIDEFEDDDTSEYEAQDPDLESGERQGARVALNVRDKPLLSSIVPIYRRDCQTEVYAGSHVYPGEGVYLLKFDNSYSLWRSKTLYFRVFYTR